MTTLFDISREDLVINPSAIRLDGSAPASSATFKTGFRALSFSGSAMNEVYFDFQVPHGRKPGSDLLFHVHWTPSGTIGVGNTVVWKLDYIVANINADFSASNTLAMTHTGVASDDADVHLMSSSVIIPGKDINESAIIKCRLWRDVATDSYTGAVFLHSADAHVYKDRIGGRI